QIFGDLRSGEALTVKGNFQGLDAEGLRLVGFENADVRRWTKLLDQLARRIVIPIKKIDIDARVLEPHHLLVEKQGGFEALEANVIQVSGDDHEVDTLGDGRVQNLLKGSASSVANLMNRSPGIVNQSLERSIE